LDIKSGELVFTIASCGANAITLLLDNPSQVIALDLAHPQICMAKLQVACFKNLSYQEMLVFLGINSKAASPEDRWKMYEEKLKTHLETNVQSYWDEMKTSIEHGVIHCGRRNKKLRASAEDYFKIALDRNDIEKLLGMGEDMEEQVMFFRRAISTKQFRTAFDCLVWKRILAKYDFSKIPDIDYASMWFERLANIIETIPAKTNYFLEYLLTGDISGDNSIPEYLSEENFAILKQRIDRIKWVEADLVSWFKSYHQNNITPLFNKVCFSNVPDWLDRDDFSMLIKDVVKVCEPNSRIVFFTAKGRGKYWPAEVVDEFIKIEDEFEIASVIYDRAPWWEPIRVGTTLGQLTKFPRN